MLLPRFQLSFMLLMLYGFLLLIFTSTIAALEPVDLVFDNRGQEERYTTLIKKLRCLVCQNQSLADSNSELARDLRKKTYKLIKSDSTDTEIIDYMVERYGEFILYKPPINSRTLALWFTPLLITLIGLTMFFMTMRRQRRLSVELPVKKQKEISQMIDTGE